MDTLTIKIPKQDKERLSRLALRFGLSLPEFSRKVLEELTSEIAEESFNDYKNPRALKRSFEHALKDWDSGNVYARL